MIITREVIIFLWYILAGVIGGIFFDLFRAIRQNRKTSHLIVYMEDMIFWIVLGMFFLWISNVLDAGQIRLYMFIGMILGGITYFLTLGKAVYKVLSSVCRYLFGMILCIGNLFRRPTNEEKSKSA